MLHGHALHCHSNGIHGAADARDPFIALKLFEAQCHGFEECRSRDFDGMGDAVHVGNRDAAGSDLHSEKVSYSLFVRHMVLVGLLLSELT